MYELTTGRFTTPKGRTVGLFYRSGTNDADVLRSCLDEDEYRLRDLSLTGWAADIGSHIGAVAVALLVDFPALSVVVVEPIVENLNLIRMNLDAIDVDPSRVRIVDGAAAADGDRTAGISVLFTGDESAAVHTFVGNQRMHPETLSERRTVPAFGLSDVIRFSGAERLSFLKIDCEGCEYPFLGSSPEVVRVDVIVGEYHGGREELRELLGGTHMVVTWDGDDEIGMFRADRRIR